MSGVCRAGGPPRPAVPAGPLGLAAHHAGRPLRARFPSMPAVPRRRAVGGGAARAARGVWRTPPRRPRRRRPPRRAPRPMGSGSTASSGGTRGPGARRWRGPTPRRAPSCRRASRTCSASGTRCRGRSGRPPGGRRRGIARGRWPPRSRDSATWRSAGRRGWRGSADAARGRRCACSGRHWRASLARMPRVEAAIVVRPIGSEPTGAGLFVRPGGGRRTLCPAPSGRVHLDLIVWHLMAECRPRGGQGRALARSVSAPLTPLPGAYSGRLGRGPPLIRAVCCPPAPPGSVT